MILPTQIKFNTRTLNMIDPTHYLMINSLVYRPSHADYYYNNRSSTNGILVFLPPPSDLAWLERMNYFLVCACVCCPQNKRSSIQRKPKTNARTRTQKTICSTLFLVIVVPEMKCTSSQEKRSTQFRIC